MEDPFEEELRTISRQKRIFQARTENVLLKNQVVNSILSLESPKFLKENIFTYKPFEEDPTIFGLYFDQNDLINETAALFRQVREHFKDTRENSEILTDCLMVVFWSNILMGYFEHILESEMYKFKELELWDRKFSEERKRANSLVSDLETAYAFRNLSIIASESRIPSGNPYDFQWCARLYLSKKIESREAKSLDYIGNTRWYDGLLKLYSCLYEENKLKTAYKFFPEHGIDKLKTIPVYLDPGDQMPLFGTTVKSSPRTLEDVLRECNSFNGKFFREVLNLVEFSFELSVNLEYDVGLAIEKNDGTVLIELFPQTYIHSSNAAYLDILCIPEKVMELLREIGKETIIASLMEHGFESESGGRLVLKLDSEISWEKWNKILDLLRIIINL